LARDPSYAGGDDDVTRRVSIGPNINFHINVECNGIKLEVSKDHMMALVQGVFRGITNVKRTSKLPF
jgi:hypothetical protein